MSLAEDESLRDLPDRAVRQSLRHREHLRVLLQEALPDLADRFVVERARLVERLFPLEDWHEREADVVYEVPFRIGAAEVYALVVILVEHQSATDRMMPFRLLLYAVLYWERQWREWAKQPEPRGTLKLCPVVPLVLYTAPLPWGSTTSLVELLGAPEELHAFAPQWEPLIWNLAEKTPEQLLASASEWLKALAVLRAEDAAPAVFEEVLAKAVEGLAPLAGRDQVRWAELMRILLSWALWRRPQQEHGALVEAAVSHMPDTASEREVRNMVQKWSSKWGPTIADLAREEGMNAGLLKGKHEGLREGKREGALKSARTMLQIVIEGRFGAVPSDLLKRIKACKKLAQLQDAARKVSQIASLDELPL